MPKKRNTRKQPQELEDESSSPDRVDEFATMYPVFCTASIPVDILDELIDEANKGLDALIEGGLPGYCLRILDTMGLDSIVHGSRKPIQPFESPFIGITDNQIRSWMNKHPHPYFAYYTFAVLDKDTIKNKTYSIGYRNSDNEMDDKMLITDFFASMYIRVPLEMVTISWCEEDYVGTGEVYNRKCIEDGWRKLSENIVSG